MAAKIWKTTGKPWFFLRGTFGLKHSSATLQGELWAHLSIRLSFNHFKSDPTTGLFPLLFQIQLLKKENKTNLIMLGWEAQLNVRVTATSPTKSQTSNVTTGSAKSRLEITSCYHQQSQGCWRSKVVMLKKLSFPQCSDSALILSLNHQHRGEIVQKATFCHFQTKEISSIQHGHIRNLPNPQVCPSGGSSRCHFQYFSVNFLTYRAGFWSFQDVLSQNPLPFEMSAPRDPSCLIGIRNFMGGE